MMRRLEQLRFRAMGTECALTVTVGARDAWSADRALAAGRAEVARCEAELSRFDARSDLSRLNAAAGDWVEVGPRLAAALAAALDAREATGGRFDPTILPAVIAAGYDRSYELLRPRAPSTVPDWRAGAGIDLDPAANRARLAPGTGIDLGGIGKGFSASRALDAMRGAWPLMPGALVDLGGDMSIWGVAPDGPWRIAVADPHAPGAAVDVLELTGAGVATSGRDRRRLGPGGRLHHLIDPATGVPAEPGPLTVTVVAPDAAQAEAHATALAITPVRDAPAYVAVRPGLSAVIVPHAGTPLRLGARAAAPFALPRGVPA